MQIILVFSLLAIAIILFSIDRFRIDLITVGILVCLIISGILSPAQALSGYASEFILILASIFVISGALQQNGILDLLGSRLFKIVRMKPSLLMAYIMSSAGFTSAFMNNTTVAAMFVGPVSSVGKKMKINPSRLLIPLAYASILGGTCTLIGTSTNIAVSGYIKQNGLEPVAMFEILPVGLVLFFTGMIYMLTIGSRILPDRKDESIEKEFHLREYISEAIITPNSPLIGQNIFRSTLSNKGFNILNIIRNNVNLLPDNATVFNENDILIVKGKIDDLISIKETTGIEIKADLRIDKSMQNNKIRLVEMLVTPRSVFANCTLKEINFRQVYGLNVIAINRLEQSISQKIGKVRLRVGDVLLVQGLTENMNDFKNNNKTFVLSDIKPILYKKRKGIFTILLFILGIVIGSLNMFPLSISMLSATVLIVILNQFNAGKIIKSIDWQLLIMIGGMTAFGIAMKNSGAADWLAHEIIQICSPFGLTAILGGFIVLTVFLTQPMSNAAAALVVLPIAIATANELNANPRTFSIAVMLSASVSLLTPFEPSCLLVYGPGKYRFIDFFKNGILLTLILMGLLLWLVPLFWPL
jgi:di/tricarboxylate transporter